jgi:ferredoxin
MPRKTDNLRSCGVISNEELIQFGVLPSDERLAAGPVAIIECIEEIPCNPCEAICHKGAISIGFPIINLPKIDRNLCEGCGH